MTFTYTILTHNLSQSPVTQAAAVSSHDVDCLERMVAAIFCELFQETRRVPLTGLEAQVPPLTTECRYDVKTRAVSLHFWPISYDDKGHYVGEPDNDVDAAILDFFEQLRDQMYARQKHVEEVVFPHISSDGASGPHVSEYLIGAQSVYDLLQLAADLMKEKDLQCFDDVEKNGELEALSPTAQQEELARCVALSKALDIDPDELIDGGFAATPLYTYFSSKAALVDGIDALHQHILPFSLQLPKTLARRIEGAPITDSYSDAMIFELQ